MKIKKYVIFLMLCFYGSTVISAQQLPYRSAFGATDFQFNPAMTAFSESLEWGLTYRQQWLGFDSAPSTGSAFIQIPLVYNKMSVGGSIERDEAAFLARNNISFNYSYKFKTGNSGQLSIGVLASIGQYRLDATSAIFVDEGDELIVSGELAGVIPNFGFGVFYVNNSDLHNASENTFYFGL